MRVLLLGGSAPSVRMLWSRSASLMSTTRMSSAIARNILRMFSACCCSWLSVLNLESFVTPSTRWATSTPKRSSRSASVYSVSSGMSCSSAAWTATGSRPSSARICRDRERMGDVRLAARALLAGMRLGGEVERRLDRRHVGVGIALQELQLDRREGGAHRLRRDRDGAVRALPARRAGRRGAVRARGRRCLPGRRDRRRRAHPHLSVANDAATSGGLDRKASGGSDRHRRAVYRGSP